MQRGLILPHSIVPPPWYGQGFPDPTKATGRPLRWGIIAPGKMSEALVQDLRRLDDAVPYAVSSRSLDKAQAFARQYGFSRAYAGYDELIRDPQVEVVYIGTPHAQHYEIAASALRAGRHVLCEKSFTIHAREAVALVELARKNQCFLMEAMWARFVPGMQRVFALLASGMIGPVRWVQADFGFAASQDAASRLWAREAGGGALLDLTVYPLLWALAALGSPDTLHASGTLTDQGVDAQNALLLTYAGGEQAQLTSSLQAFGPRKALLGGTDGYIETIGGSLHNPSALHICSGRSGHSWSVEREEHFSPIGRYTYELREVTRCVQQGLVESPTMPWADSIAVMQILDEARKQLGVIYPNDASRLGSDGSK